MFTTLGALIVGLLAWCYWGCLVLPVHSSGTGYVPPAPTLVGAIQRAEKRELRVLSFNMFLRATFCIDPATRWNNDYKRERMQGFLEYLDDYDVLALQETWLVMGEHVKLDLMKQAEAAGFVHWVRSPCAATAHMCVMDGMLLLMSRHPIEHIEFVTYTRCRWADCAASKGAIAVRVVPFGDHASALDVVVTHTNAWEAADIRVTQLQELTAFIEQRQSDLPGFPLIIAADLNIYYGDSEWKDVFHQHPLLVGYHDLVETDLGPEAVTFNGDIMRPSNQGRCDYILWKPASGASHGRPKSVLSLGGGTRIDHFSVEGKPYKTLSDHFGVSTLFQCAPSQ